MAFEDALARPAADIGAEEVGCGAAQGEYLGDAGKGGLDRLEGGDVRVGEAARLRRRPGDRMRGTVGKKKRLGEVVGDPFGA